MRQADGPPLGPPRVRPASAAHPSSAPPCTCTCSKVLSMYRGQDGLWRLAFRVANMRQHQVRAAAEGADPWGWSGLCSALPSAPAHRAPTPPCRRPRPAACLVPHSSHRCCSPRCKCSCCASRARTPSAARSGSLSIPSCRWRCAALRCGGERVGAPAPGTGPHAGPPPVPPPTPRLQHVGGGKLWLGVPSVIEHRIDVHSPLWEMSEADMRAAGAPACGWRPWAAAAMALQRACAASPCRCGRAAEVSSPHGPVACAPDCLPTHPKQLLTTTCDALLCACARRHGNHCADGRHRREHVARHRGASRGAGQGLRAVRASASGGTWRPDPAATPCVQARHSYVPCDIRWQEHFDPCIQRR